MKRSTLAALAGLLGYGIFGFSFLFSKMALALTTPFILLSIRFLAAFLVLNLLVLTGKARLNLRGKPVRPLLLLGLVQPVIYFICENYGIAMTSSAFSGIMLGIVPVIGLGTGAAGAAGAPFPPPGGVCGFIRGGRGAHHRRRHWNHLPPGDAAADRCRRIRRAV